MFEALRWRRSLRRNANFWDWVENNYSVQALERIAEEVTNSDLLDSFNPLGNMSMDQYLEADGTRQKTVRSLYIRYCGDIWSACLASYEKGRDSSCFSCLSRLDFANQVFEPEQFEEFMVRNALKHVARQILHDRS
jgi:hypothetical protein